MKKSGKVYDFGDVILVNIPFVQTGGLKKRPGVVLFSNLDNLVIAGISSNLKKMVYC